MAHSQVEKRIAQKRHAKGILVPLLVDLFSRSVEIEEDDLPFLLDLLEKMVTRQGVRNSRPVFSPSQLSSCLRYVYLLKHHSELGVFKKPSMRPEANYYFFTGNWIHLKWQLALHKLDKRWPDEKFQLLGVEVPILSKRKDHGGTVDALVAIELEPVIVDFKGLNVRTFSEITRGYVPPEYALQIADYGMLFNSPSQRALKITKGLLVAENKGGPDPKHPIALHESEIPIKTYLPEIRGRLEVLRSHEQDGEIPEPECTSTQTLQFQGCPFSGFCRKEVKEIQRRNAASEDTEGYRVAVPGRNGNRRSRRNSKRRAG